MANVWVEKGAYVRVHLSERFFIEAKTGDYPKDALIIVCRDDEDSMRCVSELVNMSELATMSKAITQFVDEVIEERARG